MITISEETLPQVTRTLIEDAAITNGLDKDKIVSQLIIWLSDRLLVARRILSLALAPEEINRLKKYLQYTSINGSSEAWRRIKKQARANKDADSLRYADQLSEFAILHLILDNKREEKEGISANQYAKRKKCSRQYICKQIAEGKIKAARKIKNGRLVWEIKEGEK